MKSAFKLASVAAVAFIASPALAGTVSGAGGPIPAATTGPNPLWAAGTMPATLPPAAGVFMSSVSVPVGVASVTSITFDDLVHAWIGDLHAVLQDPSGDQHNIFVRPGLFATSSFGNSGDFNGDYTFVESGGLSLPTTSSPVVNPPSGTYSQTFGGSAAAGATWVDGHLGIFNTPMSSISGSAGTWTLIIYDWFPTADSGSLGGWTLDYVAVPGPGGLALLGLAGLVGTRRRR